MFIHDDNKSLFEVIADHDNSCDPEDRWKELRNGVAYYNMHNGTRHELTGDLLSLYWEFLKATGRLVEYNPYEI